MEDAERVQKLKEKYNQLKQAGHDMFLRVLDTGAYAARSKANATLKKGFLDKQEDFFIERGTVKKRKPKSCWKMPNAAPAMQKASIETYCIRLAFSNFFMISSRELFQRSAIGWKNSSRT